MKTLWNTLSLVAVLNMFALLFLLALLWQQGGFDGDRLSSAWEALTVEPDIQATLPVEEEGEEAADPASTELAFQPLASEAEVRRIAHVSQVHEQARRRLVDERDMLIRQLESISGELARREAALEAERAAWHAALEEQESRKTDAQFQHAVSVLAALPAKQARDILLEMIRTQGPIQGMQEATSYLNAMSVDTAARIIREMKQPDQQPLAADLLENLRRFGLPQAEDTHGQPDPASNGSASTDTQRSTSEGVGSAVVPGIERPSADPLWAPGSDSS